jgi:hypothetical protein
MRLEQLDERLTPASVFAASGPEVFEYSASGDLLRTIVAFNDAPSIPVHVAATNGFIVIGAGVGGGPRMVAINTTNMVELWSRFVGDPNSRHGVNVAVVDSVAVRARSNATFPPSQRAIDAAQSSLDRMYPESADLISGWNIQVFDAPAITSLERFAPLKGVETPGNRDHGRTYDQVRSATDLEKKTAYVNASFPHDAIHEAGHAVAHETYGPSLSPNDHEVVAGEFELWGRLGGSQ